MSTMQIAIEENKRNAIAFYEIAYRGKLRKAVELYVGDDYIQHNPLVGNGTAPFIAYFERMLREIFIRMRGVEMNKKSGLLA